MIHVAPPMEHLMKGVPQSRILEWLDKTLDDNDQGQLRIAYHMEADYDTGNCLAIHDELEKRGLTVCKRLF